MSLLFAPKIEMVPVAALRPSPNNARQHSRKQVAQIVASMRRFGFTKRLSETSHC